LGGLVTGGVLALAYDAAGRLRSRDTELIVTVGATAVVVAVLALLMTGIAPGHVNLS
jgi:hypothetical protein